ncbi:M17 family metallopeptidase [Spiroplasma endosymbiont of Crioceris asparagi]|uniref:M17 family metallopeptidase n=1 Tax=Spiroplasma endosymbiont of Crioceris asparagi TaxID=3066286 RepID=UPI0030D547DC
MITKNSKEMKLSIKAIDKDFQNEFVAKDFGAVTFVSEDKTIYVCLNKEKQCKRALEKVIKNLVKGLKYDVNFEIESFLNFYNDKEQIFQLIVEWTFFANHKQISYKTGKSSESKTINFIFDKGYDDLFEKAQIKSELVNFARDLQDLPPNLGTTIDIAEKIVEKAKGISGVKVTVYNKKQIEEMKMGLLLGVNAGSHVEPRVVVCEYVGDKNAEKIAFVGKGITFDSGGYNLKPSNFLKDMKFDMSGAAICSSAVMALAKAKAKCNVISIAMLTDNRIGGKATLTESVLTSMNGTTVEIGNTDAEGRLVLADGICYAVRKANADKIVEASTLTGAIDIALGAWFTGTFSTNDSFHKEFELAAKKSGEPIWRMPVIEDHLEAMKNASPIADMNNSEPGRQAGSSTAAAFLNVFAEGKPYIHLDIASTADKNGRGNAPMLKTMFELANK